MRSTWKCFPFHGLNIDVLAADDDADGSSVTWDCNDQDATIQPLIDYRHYKMVNVLHIAQEEISF